MSTAQPTEPSDGIRFAKTFEKTITKMRTLDPVSFLLWSLSIGHQMSALIQVATLDVPIGARGVGKMPQLGCLREREAAL